MNLFVTGATGFVGGALLERLSVEKDRKVFGLVRRSGASLPRGITPILVGADSPLTCSIPLDDVHVVIHCAARVHVMQDAASDPLAAFREVNVAGTLNLARQAAKAGVKRFIFISSIKVNGESTSRDVPYLADTPPAPVEPYGISKLEAEQGLRSIAAATGMEVVIIRPPLVYGAGVKANFLNMMRWLYKGVPLPFGAIHNRRSLVALDNLVDLIVTCIDHPAAANQTFLISDGEDLSTTELLRRMALALDKPALLLPVPSWLLQAGAAVLGKNVLSQRLCGSLQVDISKTHDLLNWVPPCSVDEALRKTAKHFLEQQAK